MTPAPERDLVIIGAGLLGSALSAEALRQGLTTCCVGPDEPSRSLAAGSLFRLNTWSKPGRSSSVPTVETDQHPTLSRELKARDPSRFPVASALGDVSRELLHRCGVERAPGLVRRVDATATGVRVHVGRRVLRARAALICLGWGPLRVELERPAATKLVRAHALDFTHALHALVDDTLRTPTIAVVGAGPSALSFLEACVGVGPSPHVQLDAHQHVLWLSGTHAPPDPRTGVGRMFQARYAPLFRQLEKDARVTRVPHRVTDARRSKGRWSLTTSDGVQQQVDDLVWCGGFLPPLGLLGPKHVPLVQRGVHLALQRTHRPVFQVGPALDQLGLADWDTGPFCEWFEKGKRLLTTLKRAR